MKLRISWGWRFPRLTIGLVLLLSAFFALQLQKLHWETDARVYLPKGHPAIEYDEKVIDWFGVKDALVILIQNDQGIYQTSSLERVKRITEKVASLPGVVATRTIDVESLSTAELFVGDDTSMGAKPIMPEVPKTAEQLAALQRTIKANASLFVGNLVSPDGTATMIRARLKEGIKNRYQAYFMIKGILQAERFWEKKTGKKEDSKASSDTGKSGDWKQKKGDWGKGNWQQSGDSWQGGWNAASFETPLANGDRVLLAGRPVIEVTSGLQAMGDMKLMVPVLLLALAVILGVVFRTARGVILPLSVMLGAIVWTLGSMVVLGVPMYTISTMLPVILVAVGIGDSVHLMSHYYDEVLEDPHRDPAAIMGPVLQRLGKPLLMTTVTTAIGFLALLFAEMPPFRIFGLFAVLGIAYSWLLTVFFIPAVLALVRPKVGQYLKKKKSLRLHQESDTVSRALVSGGRWMMGHDRMALKVLLLVLVLAVLGSSRLFVDSSWMSDFKADSEVVAGNNMINDKFRGSVFLNVVIEGDHPDTLKDPLVLHKIEGLQRALESLPVVGRSLSIVDYIKSANRTLHEQDQAYYRIPDSRKEIGEQFYVLSLSGRPELLDQVIDYDFRRTLVTVPIKTDHTRDLKRVMDRLHDFVDREMKSIPGIQVHLAGSANNSYIWADLLIGSQATAVLWSKVGIFLLAVVLFRVWLFGALVIVPVSVSTVLIAAVAGVFRIPLDVSTTLAAGVAIGVGVDYAIHFLYRYRWQYQQGDSSDEALLNTLRSVGKTIVLNAVVVAVGFATLMLSQFPPHVKLGYFVSAYMVLSCLVTLFVLPVLLRRFGTPTALGTG